ncbi:SGNH/GDSL hydrolase family protein [Candidatus Electronema sp. JC]|uniref:SGNH/GDSL hydrolase family protein n=1 Tax=Candidatus Electronema sp. JC TaxID=3401570 RepID=UPI003B429670
MTLHNADAAGSQPIAKEGLRADMSSFMVLGDSIPFGYMAGYTKSDGTPLPEVAPELVPHSWPKLVADQAGSTMLLPFTSVTPDNLAVPGYALGDMTKKYSELKAVERLAQATDLVFSGYAANAEYGDMTPVEYLLKKNPSTVAVMIGNNDVLGAAISANIALKTPVDVFEQKYEDLVKTLADTENTNRAVVVSTIPDVSSIPFLVSVQTMPPQTLNYPAVNDDGSGYQMHSDDFITLSGVQKMQAGTQLIKCPGSSNPAPQCSGDILTIGEVAEISSHTKLFNDAIRKAAGARSNVAVMSFDRLFSRLRRGTLTAAPVGKEFALLKQKPGIAVDGKRYTTAYGGGLFSKDGIHPSKLGHGVLANEMIKTLNQNFSANIPLLDLGPVAAGDELANPVAPAAADSRTLEKSRSLFHQR